MATTPVPAPGAPAAVEQPKFDPQALIASRNAAEEARKTGKTVEPVAPAPAAPAKPAAAAPGAEPEKPRRSRRTELALREEVGRLKGLLEAKTEPAAPAAPAAAPDPEPERAKFATDAEYNRELGRWEARQESKKVLEQHMEEGRSKAEVDELKAKFKAMDEKAAADSKLIADWDTVAEAAEADGRMAVDWQAHPSLFMHLGESDCKASVLYHWAKHPEILQEFLQHPEPLRAKFATQAEYDKAALKWTEQYGIAQDRAFRRLEGRVEKLYTTSDPGKAAAPAAPVVQAGAPAKPAAPEQRTVHPADGQDPGRNSAERDARKPKPSAEVAAPRGGAPAPEEPAPGTAAWMSRRNQMQFGR